MASEALVSVIALFASSATTSLILSFFALESLKETSFEISFGLVPNTDVHFVVSLVSGLTSTSLGVIFSLAVPLAKVTLVLA